MKSYGKIGWIMSLRDESPWGSTEDFYWDFENNGSPMEGEVYGDRIRGGGKRPRAGDGIAFYHSSRADFGESDPFKGKPRISLIGELRKVRFEDNTPSEISVSFEMAVLRRLKKLPIIRNERTKHLFERCGIIAGPPYTWYLAGDKEWQEILKLAGLSKPAILK